MRNALHVVRILSLGLAVWLAVVPLHAACPGFTLRATHPGAGNTPFDIAAGDFNRDGKMDLVVVNLGSNNISVLMGNGDGTFATRVNYSASVSPSSVAVGDFNGDLYPDLATTASGTNLGIHINNGNGTFANRVGYTMGSTPDDVAVGDLNGDGRLDVATASLGAVVVRFGTGTGTFGAATSYTTSGTPTAIAIGDMNNDNKPDVVVADSVEDSISILLNNGDGTLGTSTAFADPGDPMGIDLADFNHDGKLDIVTSNWETEAVAVLLGNGNGGIASTASYPASNLYAVEVADFNSDGHPDVAAASVDSNAVFVLHGAGNGTLGSAAQYQADTNIAYPYSVVAADFNNDGSPDIASANYDSANVSIFINDCSTLPSITTIVPPAGPSAGGQTVVIHGANLGSASSVKFDSLTAAITGTTAGTITVTTPAHAAGAVNVVVTTPLGTATSTNGYTYADPPTGTSVTPNTGSTAGGQTGVVITGTNLATASSVTFGGANAPITNTTATTVTVTTPAHAAGAVDVVVTTGGGVATVTNGFTYLPAPTITSVSPNAGPTAGNQTVTVNGTNLSGATNVTFGGTAATITNTTATTVTVTTPARTAGQVTVAVTTPAGTVSSNNAYRYVAPPTITTRNPSAGPVAGGQSVAIGGTNLSNVTSVTFDGLPATLGTNTSTSITVTTPAHAAGAVNIVVTTAGGSATSTGGYTYVEAPTFTSIAPTSGPTAGGQTGVVITGTNLSNPTQVRFSPSSNATVTNSTATTITLTTPAHSAGTVNVQITTAGGSVTANNAYTFVAAPTITSVAPNRGPVVGGQTGVVITGTNLATVSAVTIGGTAATITNVTATTVTVTTPAHAAGTVNVVVTAAGGTATSNNAYTYVAAPTITNINPASGPVAGGQTGVVVTGTNLSNTSSVTFDGLAATITNNTSTTVTVTTPPHPAAGAVPVIVTTPGGTASSTFTYVAGAATHFAVSAPASATAGTPIAFTVTALDAAENIVTNYAGTVHFTSTDAAATLPADATLINGTASFSATLRTNGSQTITASDGSISNTSNAIDVAPSAVTQFRVTAPATILAGSPLSFTVTALDAFANTVPGYSGTVHFTSSDLAATVPADSTLTNGTGTFSATLRTSGSRTITAVDDGILGTSNAIDVAPSATTHFTISAPPSASAGVSLFFSVTALDTFENVATGYSGTAHFTSNDAAATLPADATLTNGTGTFSATLYTAGSRTITATDGGITGTSSPIDVTPAPATRFVVTAPASTTAGVPLTFTVTAFDVFDNIATGNNGTAHFTSNDAAATLPADAALTNGVGTFSATLRTTGARTITATAGAITATSNTIDVAPAAAANFTVSAPASATAGIALSFTITARDAFDNVASGYAGTVHFTSNDGVATMPADATLTNGTGTFSATLRTNGSQTITATDGGITGTSNGINVTSGTASRFEVSAPASATAGIALAFTVTAFDAFDNIAIGYSGTAHFTSDDALAALPANATLTNGAGTFSATLRTAGSRTITATDGGITGTSNAIDVAPAAASIFTVAAPASATAGVALNFTVTAFDAFDNIATGYSGTAHFTSTDPAATLPADSTLTNGIATFSATLHTSGSRTITATDGGITGTSNAIDVTSATATRFSVTAPASTTAGVAVNFTVTAYDAFDNIATGYSGTAHFTSTDTAATLPADSTLTNGTGTFSATFHTSGSRTITASDGSITGTSSAIEVLPVATTHFTLAAPASATAGVAFTFTVTARDAFENVATAYSGTAHFTSDDATATLPANSTLTNGSGTFTATLRTTGSHTITASDQQLTGQASLLVNASTADRFVVEAGTGGALGTQTAGTPFAIRVSALDSFGNVDPSFTGNVTLSTTAGAIAPSTITFAAGDAGVHTENVTVTLPGSNRTITATAGPRNGTSAPFAVEAGALDHFRIEAAGGGAIGTQTTDVPFAVRITALDANDNIATSFLGSASISSTGTLVTGSGVTAVFTNGVLATHLVSFGTDGSFTLTATAGSNSGTSSSIVVGASADLAVTLTGSTSTLAGGEATYTMVVRNHGPSIAHAPLLTLTLPAGWELQPTAAPCTSGFPCTVSDLASGQSRTIGIRANVAIDAAERNDVRVTVSSSTSDPSSSNNSAIAHTTIESTPDECPEPMPLIVGAVAEVSSGARYHVSWPNVGATSYEYQESNSPTFDGAPILTTTEHAIARSYEASSPTPYFYRVRAVIECQGEHAFSEATRVVVQPRTSNDGQSLDLMVENGSIDVLAQSMHLDAPATNDVRANADTTFLATSDQAWLVVSPASGSIPPSGLDLTLTAHTNGRAIGTSTATVHVATSDGAFVRDIRVNLHVAPRMTAEGRTTPVPENAVLLPAVAHAAGVGSFWQSDMRLHNPSHEIATYALTFTPTGVDGTTNGRRVEAELAGGATIAFDDVVRRMFGYGAIENESAIGSLEVRPLQSSTRAVVSSRTYAVTSSGTYGQTIPPLGTSSFAAAGSKLSLQHLEHSDAYRTNVGLVEGAGHPATVRVRVYDGDGHELAQFDEHLARLEQRQINGLLAAHGIQTTNARIDLELLDGNALLGAYASVVDNRTSDPILVPAMNAQHISATRYIVAGVADLNTGRNTWRTDIRIHNPSPATVNADLVYIAQGEPTMVTKSIAIAAGETKALDDVLHSFFGLTGTGGALHIVTPTLSNLMITARTYDAQTNGTYGQFIPAATTSDATGLGDRALDLLQLEQSPAYRSNVGFVEVAGHAAQVEVTAVLPDGRTSTMTFDLAAYEFRQLTSLLRALGFDQATNARITFRVITGSGRVTGYASIIDNRTEDPTYMLAQ